MKKASPGKSPKGTAPKKQKTNAGPSAGPSFPATTAETPAAFNRELTKALKNQKALVARAEKSVTEWRYATELMEGAHPLFHHIGFRGLNQWKAADRRWLPAKPEGDALHHGLDEAGRVQLVHRGRHGVLLFQRTPDGLDEIVLAGADSMLTRSWIQDGRTVATGTFRLIYHEYHIETYDYDAQGRCTRSTKDSWLLDDNGAWEPSSITRTADYEYDEAGLSRAYDRRVDDEPRKLMYQRRGAGPRKTKGAAAEPIDAPRRPFVAYTFDAEGPADEPYQPFYSDAYGLEMTIDDEWPIDTVMLYPPERVAIVNDSTDVTSMGTVYIGMSSLPAGPALRKAIAAEARWVLIDAEDPDAPGQIARVMTTKLNVVLLVGKPNQVSLAFPHGKGLGAKRLVVAFRTAARVTPEASQKKAKQVRDKLREHKAADARVVMASNPRNKNLLSCTSQSDVDGALILDGDYVAAIDLLSELAIVLESASSESD